MSRFPTLRPKPHIAPTCVLESQIYIADDVLTAAELREVTAWAQAVHMEGPKKPGRGEAERTSRRGALDSTEIAEVLLECLRPQIAALQPGIRDPLLSPNIRVYHYPPGTFFRPHYDTPQLDPTTRRLSCWTVLIYLSTPRGGGTTFHLPKPAISKKGRRNPKGGPAPRAQDGETVSIDARAGRVLFHWHGVAGGGCLLHEGEEVIGGDKWILRTDVIG